MNRTIVNGVDLGGYNDLPSQWREIEASVFARRLTDNRVFKTEHRTIPNDKLDFTKGFLDIFIIVFPDGTGVGTSCETVCRTQKAKATFLGSLPPDAPIYKQGLKTHVPASRPPAKDPVKSTTEEKSFETVARFYAFGCKHAYKTVPWETEKFGVQGRCQTQRRCPHCGDELTIDSSD